MKYCVKCGNPMEDDMLFCQKCGTKSLVVSQITSRQKFVSVSSEDGSQEKDVTKKEGTGETEKTKKKRPVLNSLGIFFLVLAALTPIMFLTGGMGDDASSTMLIGGFLEMMTLGGMFFVLSKSPKSSRCLFGKENGVPKIAFIIGCILLLIVSGAILGMDQCQHEYVLMDTQAATCTEDGKETYTCQLCERTKVETVEAVGHIFESNKCTVCGYVEEKQEDASQNSDNKAMTMADVKKWYENQTPAVAQTLSNYAKGVKGLTVLNVTSSKFHFGESGGWYDCHYKFAFSCQVNGVKYKGEARGFLEYGGDTVHWFHFEIFSNTGATSLVEQYDNSYDVIIEKHYKELDKKYGNNSEKTNTSVTASTSTSGNNESSNTNSSVGKPNNSINSSVSSSSGKENASSQHTCSFSTWQYNDAAQHQRVCSSCGEIETAAHSWGDEKIITQSTCSVSGEKICTCGICGGTKSIEINKLEHNFSNKETKSNYLKAKASFTSGSIYYYSCSCGERGTKTFVLDDRKLWISSDQLKSGFDLASTWMGEEIWVWNQWDSDNKYIISGSPKSQFEKEKVYTGSYNGRTIKFKYSGQITFYYDDLVSAGII